MANVKPKIRRAVKRRKFAWLGGPEVSSKELTQEEQEAAVAVGELKDEVSSWSPKSWRALRILSGEARGARKPSLRKSGASAGVREWAINIVAQPFRLDPIPKPGREPRLVETRGGDSAASTPQALTKPITRAAKLQALADHFNAIGAYLEKLSMTKASESGGKRGHPDADRRTTIGMQTLVQLIFDEHRTRRQRRPSLMTAFKEAARRFAKQEGFSKEESNYAVELWVERQRKVYNPKGKKGWRWRPASMKEALLADDVRRGFRIGAKMPKARPE